MFKRVIWWTTGAVMGAAGSALAQRKVKKQLQATAQRYAPPAVADRAKQRVMDTAYSLVDDVRDAIDDGREAASDRHQELRSRLPVGRSNVERESAGGTVTPIRPGHPSGERAPDAQPTRTHRWSRPRRG